VINIPIFARLIPKPSFLNILTIKQHILLQTFFIIKEMILKRDLSLKIVVHYIKNRAYPKRIARIDEFVSSAVESSELDLPLG